MLLKLVCVQPPLAMASEDRVDGAFVQGFVDDDDVRSFYLCVAEGVHPPMQILARSHGLRVAR